MFVFTITQLTDVLVHHLDGVGVVRALLMFGVIWWMYGGYAWLTNAMAPNSTARRTWLLTGMTGFMVIALSIPEAFGAAGWAFGLGYLVVTGVHTILFLRADNGLAARGMLALAPLNAASALLVLIGGLLPGAVRYVLWAAALALQIATPYLHRMEWHSIVAGHFVERHGLVMIVAIGLGFAGVPLNAGTVIVAVLGLCISYYLWWFYFSGDDARAEEALSTIADRRRKARMALRAWGYAHYPMLLGIVVLSAGVKKTVGHAFEPLAWGPAVALGVGAALFLLGHAWFLRIVGIRRGVVHRLGAALVILATIPLGPVVAVAQLAAVPLIMAVAAILEDLPEVRRTRSTAIHTFKRTDPGDAEGLSGSSARSSNPE